uniref:Scaffolding anchor of CK1 domain-containing protein n=1 Tax=Gouania willdenowi TaxID=441366 RepID=A0A8C5NC77_GOUWI
METQLMLCCDVFKSEDYIKPHYKESYRLAIDRLVEGGSKAYQEFLKEERIGSFLSEEELIFITTNKEELPPQSQTEEINDTSDQSVQSSSGTYWPINSDVETPNLDLGWPEVMHERLQTNIDLLYHPPRPNKPTIKEVIRRNIQEAKQVIAIVMDKFTDVDIFKETVDACIRGVPVYVLLDDFHLKCFLKMAENQDVKLQQLRNMRVRTVKGQNYPCRSGAKFNGAMEQKFLLFDCHTAIYGSYSFTWSFEKINLSMVQVISGHLVKSYDEEFRTLYARSTVPLELCPQDSLFQHNGMQRQISLTNPCVTQKIDRKDQLRHTLDTVYRKTCEQNLSTRDINERFLEEENIPLRPSIENDISNKYHLPQYSSPEAMDFLKRHSYAGEGQDGGILENIRPRGSNWNIHKDSAYGQNSYSKSNYLQVPQLYRGQNMRQSYGGNEKPILPPQSNMPTLENTSKAFMRNLRIEAYLKNRDGPFGESCDYLDQYETQENPNSLMHGRLRSSLVLRQTITEQMEPNRYTNSTLLGVLNPSLRYSSMQWNPASENEVNNKHLAMRRQSFQNFDESRSNTGYGHGRNAYPSTYASLGRPKGTRINNPDILQDNWQKRHSVADPRSNNENAQDPGPTYGAVAMTNGNKSTIGIRAQNECYGSHLNEDQRSLSHYDVKCITGTKHSSSHNWQEPPSRTYSAIALEGNRKVMNDFSNNVDSLPLFQSSSKIVKSLLNIPEKNEDSTRSIEARSLKSAASQDTLTGEDEERTMGWKHHQSSTNFIKSSTERQRQIVNTSTLEDDHVKSSKPRFRMEEHLNPPQISLPKPRAQMEHDKSKRPGEDTSIHSKGPGNESRLYNKHEPFTLSFDKKNKRFGHSFRNTHSLEKTKGFPKSETTTEQNLTRGARGHHENKLEKFIQRMGNLINKNK